jgi:hypothetical protein
MIIEAEGNEDWITRDALKKALEGVKQSQRTVEGYVDKYPV